MSNFNAKSSLDSEPDNVSDDEPEPEPTITDNNGNVAGMYFFLAAKAALGMQISFNPSVIQKFKKLIYL